MKGPFLLLILIIGSLKGISQELYVNTEPASNMASKAIGFRLTNDVKPLKSGLGLRISPEVMLGFSRHLMVHASLFGSNFYQSGFHIEGISLYGKYRFIAIDQAQSHFRIAGFGRISLINNPIPYNEISLQGDNSGYQGGLVLTQLIHKLAFSASSDLTHAIQNLGGYIPNGPSRNQIGYSLSAGYLLLPKRYTDYKQTNVNLYIELLGKSGWKGGGTYLDIAPAIQFIFGSTTRLDFSYQSQITGDLSRLSKTNFLIRLEHNLFNAF